MQAVATGGRTRRLNLVLFDVVTWWNGGAVLIPCCLVVGYYNYHVLLGLRCKRPMAGNSVIISEGSHNQGEITERDGVLIKDNQ